MDTLKADDINTKVVLGIHDSTSWETIRKYVQESALNNFDSYKIEREDTFSVADHSLLINNTQQHQTIQRFEFLNTFRKSDYCYECSSPTLKLACKLVIFEINLNIFLSK